MSNSPSVTNNVTVKSVNAVAPIAWMLKRRAGATYLFAVNLSQRPTRGSFAGRGLSAGATAEVLGESRTLKVDSGEFADGFKACDVHLYRMVE